MSLTRKSFGLIAGMMFVLLAFSFIFLASPVSAEPVDLDTTRWITVEDNDDGVNTVTITGFDSSAADSPTEIRLMSTVYANGAAKTVTRVGVGAFENANLTSVTSEPGCGITRIEHNAFRANPLSTLQLPDELTYIGMNAFFGHNLQKINLSNTGVETIGDSAFGYTTRTVATGNEVILPDTLIELRNRAFFGMRFPADFVLKIPFGLQYIGYKAFSGVRSFDFSGHNPGEIECEGLYVATALNYEWADPRGLNAASSSPFIVNFRTGMIAGMKADVATCADDKYDGWTPSTGELVIPDNIGGKPVTFFPGAISYSPGRTVVKHVTFSGNPTVETFPMALFGGCSNLETIDIPASVKRIDTYCFTGCNLEEINLRNVEYVGDDILKPSLAGGTQLPDTAVFQGNPMKKVTFESSAIKKIGTSAFENTGKSLTAINLPNMEKDSVAGAPWLANYATINWKPVNGVPQTTPALAVKSVDGKWWYSPTTNAILEYIPDTIPEPFTIPAQIDGTPIYTVGGYGEKVLKKTPSPTINTLQFESGIKRLARGAFQNCAIINNVVWPDTLAAIDMDVFENAKIQTMTPFPDSLVKIDQTAFRNNLLSGEIVLPGKMEVCAVNAFLQCPNITNFKIMQYRYAATDDQYRKAPTNIIGAGNFGASNATVTFVDTPKANVRTSVLSEALTDNDPTKNKAKIRIEGYTNHPFWIVENITLNTTNVNNSVEIIEKATDSGNVKPTVGELKGIEADGTYTFTVTMVRTADQFDATAPRETSQVTVEVKAFHTVTYDNNEAAGPKPSDSRKYVEGYGVTAESNRATVPTDCAFDGWNTKADGSGAKVAANAKIPMAATDMTLYAQWKRVNGDTTVTFNANGGKFTVNGAKVDTNVLKYNPGESFTANATAGYQQPVRAGYTFAGWNTEANGNGTAIGAVPADAGATLTVYAKWNPGTSNTSITGSNGETILAEPPLTNPQPGDVFTGTNPDTGETGTYIVTGVEVDPETGEIIVTAKKATYEVFDNENNRVAVDDDLTGVKVDDIITDVNGRDYTVNSVNVNTVTAIITVIATPVSDVGTTWKEVKVKLDKITDPITTDDKAAIDEVIAAYDNLSAEEKAKASQADKDRIEALRALTGENGDLTKAKAVADRIKALPEDVTTLTAEDAAWVNSVAAAYNRLTDDQKALIPNYLKDRLNAAIAQIGPLDPAVQNVINAIEALPTADEITEENYLDVKPNVEAARAAYEALSDTQKQDVPAESLAKLIADELKIKGIEDGLKVAEVEAMIDALPAVAAFDPANPEQVAAAREAETAYNNLGELQSEVDSGLVQKLQDILDKIIPDPGTNRDVTKFDDKTGDGENAVTLSSEGNVVIVKCADACLVAYTTDNGASYTVVEAVKSGDSYRFDVPANITDEQIAVIKKGDANGDGDIDSGDAAVISRYDIGAVNLSVLAQLACDVNGDGDVDSGDAAVIKRVDIGAANIAW